MPSQGDVERNVDIEYADIHPLRQFHRRASDVMDRSKGWRAVQALMIGARRGSQKISGKSNAIVADGMILTSRELVVGLCDCTFQVSRLCFFLDIIPAGGRAR